MPRYIAIDLETTGLDANKDRVVEFAAVDLNPFIEEGNVTSGSRDVNAMRWLFNPEMPMPKAASKINNLYDKDLKDQPLFADKAMEIQEFLKGSTLVAHNAEFDKKFLVAEFARLGIDFKSRTTCTLKKARSSLPGRKSYKLQDLNRDFKLHSGKAHSALDDAITAGKLFLCLKAMPKEMNPYYARAKAEKEEFLEWKKTKRKPKYIELTFWHKAAFLLALFIFLKFYG